MLAMGLCAGQRRSWQEERLQFLPVQLIYICGDVDEHIDCRQAVSAGQQSAVCNNCVLTPCLGIIRTVILFNKWLLAYSGFPYPM